MQYESNPISISPYKRNPWKFRRNLPNIFFRLKSFLDNEFLLILLVLMPSGYFSIYGIF